MSYLERQLVEAVMSGMRSEVALCRKFAGGRHTDPVVEDALFRLVDRGILDWYGDNSKPLKYKLTQKLAKLATKAAIEAAERLENV